MGKEKVKRLFKKERCSVCKKRVIKKLHQCSGKTKEQKRKENAK